MTHGISIHTILYELTFHVPQMLIHMYFIRSPHTLRGQRVGTLKHHNTGAATRDATNIRGVFLGKGRPRVRANCTDDKGGHLAPMAL